MLVPLIYPPTASGGFEVSDERTENMHFLHGDSDAFVSLRFPCFLIGSWSPVLTGLLVGKCRYMTRYRLGVRKATGTRCISEQPTCGLFLTYLMVPQLVQGSATRIR
jgi:hypothetical protein